jgi:hypothetical protein
MATLPQIEANRTNSQKSTGPRSNEGKAVSRFNALKSGIHAQSQVIPGEDAGELEALAAEYREQFQPESPLEMFLVDSMVAAEWRLRRLRKIEAQLWQRELTGASAAADMAEAYTRNAALTQVQRRMEAAERSYYRALKQMQQIQKEAAAHEAEESRRWREYLRSLPDEEVLPAEPTSKLASILPSSNRAGDRPDATAPKLGSFSPGPHADGEEPGPKGVRTENMPPK